MPVVSQEYIETDARGVAKLIGSRTKVRQIVIDIQGGMSPHDICEQYPHLHLAQVHAALAYYYDHKDAIDAEIAEGWRVYQELRAKNPNRMTRAEWEARWKERFPDRPFPGTEPDPESAT